MQFGPYLWPNRQNPFILYKIWVGEHVGGVRFFTGSRNMAVLRMRNEKNMQYGPIMAESPMNSAMGQIPCSTERISCFQYSFGIC